MPESVLRRYVEDFGFPNDDMITGISHRRPSRTERAIDDPIREMEGMLVDEYGRYVGSYLAVIVVTLVFSFTPSQEK